MSLQLQRTQRLKTEDACFKRSLRSLNALRGTDADGILIDCLDSLTRIFDDLTGDECQATLRLFDFPAASSDELQDRRTSRKLREQSSADESGKETFAQSAAPHRTRVAATVQAPVTMEARDDALGCLYIESTGNGFDDICEKALAAFAYEMYFALSQAKQAEEYDYLEPLSLK